MPTDPVALGEAIDGGIVALSDEDRALASECWGALAVPVAAAIDGAVDAINGYASIVFSDSPYQASAGQLIDVNTGGGSVVVLLPPAATMANKSIDVAKTTGDANTVTVTPDGAETINGAPTDVISAQWTERSYRSTGATWRKT